MDKVEVNMEEEKFDKKVIRKRSKKKMNQKSKVNKKNIDEIVKYSVISNILNKLYILFLIFKH